jgi:hypothetical protein
VAAVGYLPRFQAQLGANDPYGGLSCTAYATAMQIDAATLGAKTPTGAQVRAQTGDYSGGLNLAQADAAAQHWGVDLDVRYRYPFASFIERVNLLQQPAQLQGGYTPIAQSQFDAGNGFKGNHDILVMPGDIVLDPLADGRYPDVYRYKGAAYPEDLLRRFAGYLNVGGKSLGAGLVYAAFVVPAKPWTATVRPITGATREYTRFFVTAGRVTGHERRRTRGFQAECTKPTLVVTPSGDAKVSLVRITQGGYSGFWISSKWADQ